MLKPYDLFPLSGLYMFTQVSAVPADYLNEVFKVLDRAEKDGQRLSKNETNVLNYLKINL